MSSSITWNASCGPGLLWDTSPQEVGMKLIVRIITCELRLRKVKSVVQRFELVSKAPDLLAGSHGIWVLLQAKG